METFEDDAGVWSVTHKGGRTMMTLIEPKKVAKKKSAPKKKKASAKKEE
jgi:hypothetical protein